MYVPVQRKPIQRTLNTQPNADRSAAQAVPQGVMPSGNGIQPSFDWTSLIPVITTIAGALA